jgi:IPT/TIG domain
MSAPRTAAGRVLTTLLAFGTVLAGLAVTASPAYATGVPTVASISVVRGSTDGGTNVLITGTNFSTVSESTPEGVTFGGANALTFGVLSSTQLTAKAPPYPVDGDVVDVQVTNPTGTSVVSTRDKFTYRTPIPASVPEETLLNPVSGGIIVVTSSYPLTNLISQKITATIGPTTVPMTMLSDSTVRVTAPAGNPSGTPLSIALLHDSVAGTPDNTNARYAAIITSLSRTSGPVTGGGTITVTGKGFGGATEWRFGDAAASCTVTSSILASCVVPASATDDVGPVAVRFTPAGSATYGFTSAGNYTYTTLL